MSGSLTRQPWPFIRTWALAQRVGRWEVTAEVPPTMMRDRIMDQLADLIGGVSRPHPVRVGIDGVDASGKTTLADELVRTIEQRGSHVIRASIDGFHRPRAKRYRLGVDSPEGYYLDSFDHGALRDVLLVPLGPQGSRSCRRAVFDFRSDSPVQEPSAEAPPDAIMLFDGVFLLRPELYRYWDFRIFVDVDFDETLRRACERETALFGSADAVRKSYQARYIPGQRIYLRTVRPAERANVVLKNVDPSQPLLIVRSLP